MNIFLFLVILAVVGVGAGLFALGAGAVPTLRIANKRQAGVLLGGSLALGLFAVFPAVGSLDRQSPSITSSVPASTVVATLPEPSAATASAAPSSASASPLPVVVVPATSSTTTRAQTTTAVAPASTSSKKPSASSTSAPASGALTLAAVQQHSTSSSCWSVINGNVYDLTGWINQHPGGQSVIKALCGADGTASFEGQHGGSSRVAADLATFKKGPLVG